MPRICLAWASVRWTRCLPATLQLLALGGSSRGRSVSRRCRKRRRSPPRRAVRCGLAAAAPLRMSVAHPTAILRPLGNWREAQLGNGFRRLRRPAVRSNRSAGAVQPRRRQSPRRGHSRAAATDACHFGLRRRRLHGDPRRSRSFPPACPRHAGSAPRADHGKHQRDAKILAETHFAHLTHPVRCSRLTEEPRSVAGARLLSGRLATAVRSLRDGRTEQLQRLRAEQNAT